MSLRRRGVALLIVLIAVSAVFALAMQGAVATRATILEVGVVHDRVRAEIGARGAAVLAIKGLLQADIANLEPDDDSNLRPDANDPQQPKPEKKDKRDLPPIIKALLGEKADEIDKGVKDATEGGLRRLTDSANLGGRVEASLGLKVLQAVGLPTRAIEIRLDNRLYTIRLSDAVGGISLNFAEDAQLVRYFTALRCSPATTRALVDQIIDWRDADSVPGSSGAEQDLYTPRGITCRNAPFAALEELLYLPAMTRDLFERCRDDLSLGPVTAVHAMSVSREVLLSVDGMTPPVVDSILELRKSAFVTRAQLEDVYPIVGAEDLKKRLRYEPSSLVRLTVEVTDASADAREQSGERLNGSVTRFEGIAIIDDRGLKELGLRVADRAARSVTR